MNMLDRLAACAGTWRGTNRLHDPNTNKPEDSSSTVIVTPMLAGRFVRLDYTWAYQGRAQEGSLLLGSDADAGAVTAHWIDTWHMGDKVMACRGPAPDDATLSVRGSYAAPPGPDWGWRIDLTPAVGATLRLLMFNIDPDGREEPAVEATYTRT